MAIENGFKQERRVSPLTRFKFDLLSEKAKLSVQWVLSTQEDLYLQSYLDKRIKAIDNAVMLLNEALERGDN
jgi:hypothetical protein